MKRTEQENPGKPVMVFTGLEVVDSKLQSMWSFMMLGVSKLRYTFEGLVVDNCAAGCTEMMNRQLWSRLGSYDERIDLHDYWVSLFASVAGVIHHVPMALILYRQHSSNVIGAKDETVPQKIKNFVHDVALRTVAKWRSSRESLRHQYRKFALLRERMPQDVDPARLRALDDCVLMFSPKEAVSAKLAAMRRLKFREHNGRFEAMKMFMRCVLLR